MKRLLIFSILCLSMSITTLAQAQRTAVVPGPVTPNLRGVFTDFTTTEGNNLGDSNALGTFNNTVFSIYDESLVLAAGINPGDQLTGLGFRVGGGPSNVVPNFTVENYIIDLGHALPGIQANVNLNDVFADNAVGGALTNVHTGRVDFNAADYPNNNPSTIDGTANPFGPSIGFDNAFTYNGGDLLLRYTHSEVLSLTTGTPDGADIVTSRGDAISSTFGAPDFGDDRVQTFFGSGFDDDTRRFGTQFGEFTATIIQFDVAAVPEPTSAALLMGLGMIGVVRRRRKI